jgi:hypothetical protein
MYWTLISKKYINLDGGGGGVRGGELVISIDGCGKPKYEEGMVRLEVMQ